jgi:hypothetical protein
MSVETKEELFQKKYFRQKNRTTILDFLFTSVRGQVALFIIIGVVIVSIILVFFLVIQPKFLSDKSANLGFEGCVTDAVSQGIVKLEKKSGFVNPEFTYAYQGEAIPYLCYTNAYLETCTMQKPFLKQHFEEQLTSFVTENINSCYSNSIQNLKSQGYDVVSGNVDFQIYFEPDSVKVRINAPTRIGAGTFEKFNVQINSPIYEMLMIATSVMQSETKFGDTNTDSLMILHQDYVVLKLKQIDGTTIYSIRHKTFGDEILFASRSLVYPPGHYNAG